MDITPVARSIGDTFTKNYFIDFYQRHYRWEKDAVTRLLDDIFFSFTPQYEKKNSSSTQTRPVGNEITDSYACYYLNTYVIHRQAGKFYVVDGQQRLTTIWLILVSLSHLAKDHALADERDSLRQTASGYDGTEMNHRVVHEGLEATQKAIYNNQLDEKDGEGMDTTPRNLCLNFKTISSFLRDKKNGLQGDKHRLQTFVHYFMRRIKFVELTVENAVNIPMVFEVINDRGIGLKPHEILKGKLLSKIKKKVQSRYLKQWDKCAKGLSRCKVKSKKQDDKPKKQDEKGGNQDEIDIFFSEFLLARYATTNSGDEKTSGDDKNMKENYHRAIYEGNYRKELPLETTEEVTGFLDGRFNYYSGLYQKYWRDYYHTIESEVYYSRCCRLQQGSKLFLSVCKQSDEKQIKEEKLETISREIDRLYSLLYLQQAYDLHSFQGLVYKLSIQIRDKPTNAIRELFNTQLRDRLRKQYGIEEDVQIIGLFQYKWFKEFRSAYGNKEFIRYFLARVENFLAQHIDKNPSKDIDYLLKSGKKGYEIEHILANNDENRELFKNEEVFGQERNRIGALLLLPGDQNSSSKDEIYEDKLKTYAGTLLWNRTLGGGIYKSNPDLDLGKLNKKYKLGLEPMKVFGKEQIKQRQQTLFRIAKIIWA